MSICPMCKDESDTVERRRQNTAYVNEESNWVTTCAECFEEIEEHWAEQWREYYRDRL